MTGKGGPTSAPPAINHQRRAQDDAFGVNQRTGKIPACGVHGSHHEGLTIRAARWSTLGRPLVKQCRRANNIPAQGVHGGNHEPLHDGAKRVHPAGKFARRIRCPVPCMRTNQPNQRPLNPCNYGRQADRGVAGSASFAWWGRHFVYPRIPRVYAITTAAFCHQSLCCVDNAGLCDRGAKSKREPVGLTVSPASATIMKVVARHEAQSKMVKQVPCLRERCRWPRSTSVPEVSSGSLRWAR